MTAIIYILALIGAVTVARYLIAIIPLVFDGHSHSWISVRDAAALFSVRRYPGEEPLDPKSFEAKYPADYWFEVDEYDIDKSRLIFWFDN